jgi:hypothetical protein
VSRSPHRLALLAVSLVFGVSAACSPKLVVRHQDMTSGELEIALDREDPRSLDYGESTSWRVSKGAHRLRIQDRSGSSVAWDASQSGVLVVIERSAIFTLMPPNVAPQSTVRQNVDASLRVVPQTPVSDDASEASDGLGEASERR